MAGKSVQELVAATRHDDSSVLPTPEASHAEADNTEWEDVGESGDMPSYPLSSSDLPGDLGAPLIAHARPATPDTDTDMGGGGSRSSKEDLGDHNMDDFEDARDL